MVGDGDAEQRGHLLVLRGRLQLLAEHGALEEPVIEDHQHDGHRDDQQILAVEIDRPELDARRLEPALQHLRLRAVNRQHRIGEQDRGADGGDDHRQKGAVAQRVIDPEIEDRAQQRHAGQRDQERQPVRPAEIDGEHHHQIGGDHGEFALREIHHIGGAEDQHEAERDQRIDGADADAGEEQLKSKIHESGSVGEVSLRIAHRDGKSAPSERGGRRRDQSLNSMCLSKTIFPLSFFTML